MSIQHSTTPVTLQSALDRIAALEQELDMAHHDTAWDILTRNGIERRIRHTERGYDIVVCDIDRMHDLNAQFGHDETDRKIRTGLSLRSTDLICVGRWLRGDELVILCPSGSGLGCALRLLSDLQQHGVSATFAVVSRAPDYPAAIRTGLALIDQAKRQDRRGQVLEVQR